VLFWGNPYNHPPRFRTEPVTEISVGDDYEYDVDAIDLNIDDTVRFALEEAPEGALIDEVTGVISFEVLATHHAEESVTVVATDDRGASREQTFILNVAGGTGKEDSLGAPGDGAFGCGCQTQGGAGGPGALLLVLLLSRRARSRHQLD
jgi:MYXO-CTERM domain-containing protein